MGETEQREVEKASETETELLALDPIEVSLVDKPAIVRKFVRLKARDAKAQEVPVEKSESTPADPAVAVDSTSTEQKNVEKNEPVLLIEQDVQKAVLPVIEALIGDYLTVIQSNATAVRDGISAGTLTKEDAYSRLWGIQDTTYKVLENVCVVAKSLDIEVEEVTTQEIETEKADRKMTKRRRETLKAARDMIDTLMNELEDDSMATEDTQTSKVETAKSEAGAAASGSVAAVESAPATTQIDIAKSVSEAVTAAFQAEGAKSEERVQAAVSKALKPLEERLSALEGRPGTTPANTTTKVETEKSDKGGKDSVWGGSLLG